MAIKDLLVHLDETPASTTRLQAALTLATACRAVTALYLIAEPFLPGMGGRHLPAELLREHLAHGEAEAEAVLASARAEAERQRDDLRRDARQRPLIGCRICWPAMPATPTSPSSARPIWRTRGRRHRAGRGGVHGQRPPRPQVIPRRRTGVLPPRRAMIAWDGSREAARATSDALPLLRMAEQVLVLVLDAHDVGGRAGGQPGSEPRGPPAPARGQGGAAPSRERRHQHRSGAARAGREEAADLLVMGGYGHSRLREMMLGGTTRSILEHMTVPVLFSH